MKISRKMVVAFSIAAVSMLGLAGCKQKTEANLPDASTSTASSHGHDHADGHAHDHSVAGHAHGPGPHHGTIADWGGGKYHVEFTVDHEQQQATVYVLGGDEKTPTPIPAEQIELVISDPEMEVVLKAAPQRGDPSGSASRFVGNHKNLGVVQEYAGSITGLIDGTPYSGDFEEVAHGHGHGHSHSGDDALVWEGDPVEQAGMQILLGHHGAHLHAGEEVEPAVSITRNGKPIDDAKVFNALVSPNGKKILAEEVNTVYEPTTEQEPAHYAQGGLMIPSGLSKVILRFRIVPASGSAMSFDVPVGVE